VQILLYNDVDCLHIDLKVMFILSIVFQSPPVVKNPAFKNVLYVYGAFNML